MDTNVSARRLAQRGQEPPLRCLWQIQRGGFKAAPRLMDTNVSARRLAQRGQEPPLRCLWRIKRGGFKEVSSDWQAQM